MFYRVNAGLAGACMFILLHNPVGVSLAVLCPAYGTRQRFDIDLLRPHIHRPQPYSRAAAKFSSGEKQGALADFTKSIEINPKSADTYNNRGSIKSDLGDNKGATADYTQAIEISPSFVPAYLNRAAIKLDQGDKEGATADLLQAAKLGNADAQQWLKSNGISKW